MAALHGPFSKIAQGILFIARFLSHEKLIPPIECLNPIVFFLRFTIEQFSEYDMKISEIIILPENVRFVI